MRRLPAALISAILLGATLTGCSSPASEGITFDDAWIKATDDHMTSMFGVLNNPTSAPVTLTSVRVQEAGVVELHTIVEDDKGNMVMTAVPEGFTVDAGGTFTLEPGAEHIMLMDLHGEIAPGAHVEAELIFDDGQHLTVEVPAKEFLGAEENYHPDHGEHDE